MKKEKKQKDTKIQKRAFQLSVNFLVFGGCPTFPFLTTWPKKRAPKKHSKNRGISKAFFEQQMCVTKRQLLDQKNPRPEIPAFILLGLFSLSTRRTQKLAETPIL